MILKWKEYLKDKLILLGSTSIQRKKLLEDLDLKVEIMDSGFPEKLEKDSPLKYVQNTCKGKFDYIMKKINIKDEYDKMNELILKNNYNKNIFLVVADTICVKEDKIIEKVSNEQEAYDLIKSYSGKEIEVITSHI